MTDALDLVPAFRRQIGVYTRGTNTNDSALAGYIFDAVQALMLRWNKDYELEFIAPATYKILPDVEPQDVRPIILMASIIYKSGTLSIVSFTDGDFTWNARGVNSAIEADRQELLSYVPRVNLVAPTAGQFLGWKSIYNPEGYDFLSIADWVWR